MEMRTLGRTGIKVSPLCLGAMMFGAWGGNDETSAVPIVHAALDAGINFIDTADVYSWGGSEQIVGKALAGRRDDVVLATKVHYPMQPGVGPGDAVPNRSGNSRRWITRAVEDSLRRLGTDYIDIYYAHRPDPDTDIEETLSVLTDLVRSGKVRAIGTSTFPAEQIVEAQWVAERRGYERFKVEQPPYSILNRSVEAAVLPTCQRYGIGVLTWSPLSEGWLTGRYQGDFERGKGRQIAHPQQFDPELPGNIAKREAVGKLIDLANETGCSLIHLALAFVRAHPAVTSTIIGPRTMEQLKDLLAGAEVGIDADVLDRIDEIVPPGVVLNAADSHHTAVELTDSVLRRRPNLPSSTVLVTDER
ncbi:aldo/keto reductase [Kibdelosporangium aridum]|uniref:Aldo/keto reductase n=1 Tax=Kibdelosporangium aridum TaxID=2030 RepID=A0A428YCD8_KIBAR|nr:aldo/keto reductase [Kibdelosporangium aridum]RSM65257.1 aldo/keto reductase [Kibdelosporangium aridum]